MIRAGFGIRLGAAAIDFVAMYLSSTIVGGVAIAGFVVSRQRANAGPPDARVIMFSSLGATTVIWLAYSLTEVFGSASPAKRLLKLRIATPASEHAPPGRRVARWALKFGPMMLYVLGSLVTYTIVLRPGGPQGQVTMIAMAPSLLGFLASLVVFGGFFMTLSSERRALHDLIAGTVVLRPGEAPQGFAPLMPAAAPTEQS